MIIAPEAAAAVLSAVLVGTADFASRLNGRYFSPAQMTFFVSGFGASSIFLFRTLTDSSPMLFPDPGLWLAGALNTAGLLLLYAGIRRGPVSVVSPAAASAPALTAFMWATQGVYPTPLGIFGIVLSICGVMWMGAAGGGKNRPHIGPTLALGLAAAAALSLRMFLVQRALTHVSAVDALLAVRVSGTLCAGAFLICRRSADTRPPIAPLVGTLRLIGQSLPETVGVLAVFWASRGAFKTVAPALFSCGTLMTVLLSRVILGERLSPARVAAAVMIVTGAVILTLFTETA